MSEKDAPSKVASEASNAAPSKEGSRFDGDAADSLDEASGTPESTAAEPRSGGNAGGEPSGDGKQPGGGRRAPGRGLALFALIISLSSLAGVGWLYYQQYQGQSGPAAGIDRDAAAIAELRTEIEDRLAALGERVSSADASLERLGSGLESGRTTSDRVEVIEREQTRMQEQLDESTASQSGLDELRVTLSRQGDALQTLEGRLDQFEQGQVDFRAEMTAVETRLDRVSDVLQQQQGIQREVDRDLVLKLDLLEIAALISIGQARIELVGDKEAALAAYNQANRQLAAISDRRLNQAAERMAEEITSIESWAEPDWARFGALLAQWERQVAEWPLRPDRGGSEIPLSDSEDEEASGWLSTVRQSLGQLVTVERLDGMSLSEDMVIAIREQLQLHLAAASLAVQRRDPDMLQMRIDHVVALIEEFFQIDSEPVNSVLAELAVIAEVEAPAPPDGLGQAAAALDRVIDTL